MLFTRVIVPRWMRGGIRKNERGGTVKKIIIGFDTETCRGKPFSLQFFGPTSETTDILWTDEKSVWEDFLRWIDAFPQDDTTYVLYAINLEFDLVSLFYPIRDRLLDERFRFREGKWDISGIFSSAHFVVFRSKHLQIYLIDVSAFLPGSAKKLAEVFCPDTPKLPTPKRLGEIKFDQRNREFVRYAMRDAEICRNIGLFLESMHQIYDIQQCVSGAQMAARIFRHRFMTRDIPLPPRSVLYGALHAYHGGKNGMYVDPGVYPDVRFADISSAYPFAMHAFPSFSHVDLYKGMRWAGPIGNRRVPDLGVYRISGSVRPCRWPALFDGSFKPVRGGQIEQLWTTGYELNEAVRSGELTTSAGYGYYYDEKSDTDPSPFPAYVDRFYRLKEEAADLAQRRFYKICCLNSLYGKFIQTNGKKLGEYIYDCESDTLYQDLTLEAGGMFQPFIASLVTGSVRARIHRLEHKHKALHTATDGIITKDRRFPKKKSLGSVNIEAEGDLLLCRNKLYILYDEHGNIVKSALHGFRGGVEKLHDMMRSGERAYEYKRMVKLREAVRSGWQVNDWRDFKGTLNLP